MYIIIYIILYICSYYTTRYLVKSNFEEYETWRWEEIKVNLFFSLFIIVPLILIIIHKLENIDEIKPPKWL